MDNGLFYLVVRSLSEDPSVVAPYIEPLSELTGIDPFTLKQKFTGTSLQVLKVDRDLSSLKRLSSVLRKEGIISEVIDREELRGIKKPAMASSVDIQAGSIRFYSSQKDHLLKLAGDEKCLIVVASMGVDGLKKRIVLRGALNPETRPSLNERLNYIFHHQPVLDIYTEDSDKPVRIDSLRFNFNSLGDVNRGAITLNIPSLIKEIDRYSSQTTLETGFGEVILPFLNISDSMERERMLRQFSVYSRFVYLAYRKGLLMERKGRQTPLKDIPILNELERLLWAGPLIPKGRTEVEDKEKKSRVDTKPPQDAIVYSPAYLSTWSYGIKLFLLTYKRYVKTLGPPILFYPLTLITSVSFITAYSLKIPQPAFIGLISLGIIFFIHAFILLKRKRTIEDCPTSRIGTMPMGQVEVHGRARQKYPLRSPYTYTNCVHYSYRVYEERWRGNRYRWVLKEWGDSGNIPFYIEDDTGRVLVLPEEAVIKAGDREVVWGDGIFGAHTRSYGTKRRVVEQFIPEGRYLYVMGFARRTKARERIKKERLIARLRSLKKDPRLLRDYDIDGDGRISEDEWDRARRDVEEEILLDGSTAEDAIAIGEHPTGGLFYIADRQEDVIISSLAWRIPIFLLTGISSILAGIYYILKLL